MARKLRIEFEGAFYHVITRGNQRQRVFNLIKGLNEKDFSTARKDLPPIPYFKVISQFLTSSFMKV